MIYVAAVDSGEGAIVDVSLSDSLLLGGACDQTFEAIRSDDDFVPRTGYSAHSYRYLSLWTTENQPDAAQRLAHKAKQESLAWLKNNLGSPTASELLLATKIADIDASTVRWNLSLAALQMFDAGIREILDYFADSNPPYVELELLAGGTEEEFRTLQQDIKDVLEAVALAAPQAAVSPAVVSATAPSLTRENEESVPYNDELVAVELTEDEIYLLRHGLGQWGGPAGCTEVMAIAMGFNSVDDLFGQFDRLTVLMKRGQPLSRTDWTRALLATEVCWASDVLGAGVEWAIVGPDDMWTIEILRGLQRKLASAGALARWPGTGSPADVVAAREAARGDDEESVLNKDELVAVALTADDRWLLTHGLLQWRAPGARCTEAMAIAIGFDSVEDLLGRSDRLKALIDRGEPLSKADWTRTLLATEVCFASDVLGAGVEWDAIAGDDAFTLEVLRLLQRKLWRAGALAPGRGPGYEPRADLTVEASPWPSESTVGLFVSPAWVASVTSPGLYTIAVPAGTTGVLFLLIGGGGGGGAYVKNGYSTFVPRGARGESTTARVPPRAWGPGHSAAGGYGGISTDYAHLPGASLAAGQSTDSFTPDLFPRGFVVPGGVGGAAGNNSPGSDGGAPGAGGGPGARLSDRYANGSYGGSGGFAGELQQGLVWLSDESTESGVLQITGIVGAGGAGDSGDDGSYAGGDGGCGAAYFAFLDRPARDAYFAILDRAARPSGQPPSAPSAAPTYFTPPKFEPSRRIILPTQHGQTVEDGYSKWKLPRMRRWPDHDQAQGADPDPSSEEKSRPTNPHFASKPPHIRRLPDVDWSDLLRPKRWRPRKSGGDR
ncbi:hypothetical protein Mkiyose1088_40420 [Mycobacterium kiyosense]|uniref:hypothetical protein n=1 Tax=Mycobacterium kiyosense TaxID=2871094 RepID=UPI0021726EE2|nr:hypothetical protein [Mycobacterium kiyosense]MBX9981512.1 hypothetical protein [Mycobacterium gordonae]GLD02176.1 hypothetical protein Mkiyose1088_40420 [Mycobacterium kiyosense]